MRLDQVVRKINTLCNNSEFKTARTYIEINLMELQRDNTYLKLNHEASQLYRIIQNEKNNGLNLSRLEIHTINEINKASNNYDVSILRMILKSSKAMLDKKEVQLLLTPTAKSVLKALGYEEKAVQEEEQSESIVRLLESKQSIMNHQKSQTGSTSTARQARVHHKTVRGIKQY